MFVLLLMLCFGGEVRGGGDKTEVSLASMVA